MMNDEIREKAEKKVSVKEGFYTLSIIFSCITAVLLMLSFYLPSIAIWLTIPIPLFVMVLGLVYISAFGFPFSKTESDDWREEEITREMEKIGREAKSRPDSREKSSASAKLELKELDEPEELRKGDDEGEYV